MSSNLLLSGVYCFIIEEEKMVYIGQTKRNFLCRYIEHLQKAPKLKRENRRKIILSNKSEFKILKVINSDENSNKFLDVEKYYIEKYKENGYIVIGTPSKKDNVKTNYNINKGMYITSLKKFLVDIARALARKNSIMPYEVFIWIYKDIEKKFECKIETREGKNKIDKLTQDELEYAILRLLPKYSSYIKSIENKEYEI